MRVLVRLSRTELRLMLREPMVTFFAFLFPSVLVVIIGSIPSFREPADSLGGLRVVDVYVGVAVALTIAMLGIQFLPVVLATYREKGILRRMATTPVRPVALLGAQLVSSLFSGIVASALVLAIGRIAFDVALPAQFAGFVVAYLLASLGVFAIGLVIAAIVPTGKAGNSVGTLLFFPSMFFAGLWTPREVMPRVLQRIGDFTPLGAGERALHEATTGHWPGWLPAIVLVGYAVVFGAAAARLFRWS